MLFSDVIDNVVMSEGCISGRTPERSELLETTKCQKLDKATRIKPKVQLKHYGKHWFINCQGHEVIIDKVKHGCPNHIFSLMDNATFIIDRLEYKLERSKVHHQFINFDIPAHININLGASKKEFHSLTAEEIHSLEEKNKAVERDLITSKLSQGQSIGTAIGESLDNFIARISGYLALSMAIFLLYLKFRNGSRT